MTDRAAAAADLLAATWARGGVLAGLPGALRPDTIDEAMAIQAAFIRRHGSCGWKVGSHPSGSGWCGAPLRGASALASPHALSAASAAGMRIEVEVALVLGDDLPAGESPSDVRAAIAGTHIALELFRSSYSDPGQQDLPSLLADSLSNAGIVLGGGRAPRGDDRLEALHMALTRDGEAVSSAGKGASLDGIVEAVHWLAQYAAALGAGLRRGAVILTGARIGPLPVARAGLYRADCALGEVRLGVAP